MIGVIVIPRGLRFRAALLAAATAAVALALAGCNDAVPNTGEDDRFLNALENTPAVSPPSTGPLFPTATGEHWHTRVTLRRTDLPPPGSPGDTGVADASAVRVVTAEVTNKGTRPLPGGGVVTVLETRVAGQPTPLRAELYRNDTTGLFLAAEGTGSRTLTLNPVLPVLRYPVHVGDLQQWTGTALLAGHTVPMEGYSRVACLDPLDLPVGTTKAYRVDTVLLAKIGGRQVPLPITRWFQPGVGIVKQRFLNGATEITLDLVSYGRSPK